MAQTTKKRHLKGKESNSKHNPLDKTDDSASTISEWAALVTKQQSGDADKGECTNVVVPVTQQEVAHPLPESDLEVIEKEDMSASLPANDWNVRWPMRDTTKADFKQSIYKDSGFFWGWKMRVEWED